MTEWIVRSGWPLLVGVTVKSLVLLALAGTAALTLRRASAAARHLVWRLALAALLLLPVLSLALPGWQAPLWPRVLSAPPPVPAAMMPAPPSPGTLPVSAPPTANAVPEDTTVSPAAPLPSPTPVASPVSWSVWVCVVWLAGAVLVLIPYGLGLFGVRRLASRSAPVTAGPLPDFASALANEMDVRRPVALLLGEMGTPMTWGWLRPVILLPRDAKNWPVDRLRAVLLHELAHIARADWPAQMTGHLACALYWFHPGVWLAARQARAESERACDDRVLLSGVPAPDYARHLLDVARDLNRNTLNTALPMAQRSTVEGRLRAILHTRRRQTTMTRKTSALTLLASAAFLIPLAALRPVAAADPQTTPTASQTLRGTVIVIDPGHGAQDSGGVVGGVTEKSLNLQIAQRLKSLLEQRGAVVFLTRDSDTYLKVMDRPQVAAERHANYLISIHCEGLLPKGRLGAEVYYHANNKVESRLADAVNTNINQVTGNPGHVLSDSTRFTTGFGVLRGASMPAILVMCGYMEAPQDLTRLCDPQGQQQIAAGIAQGLIAFRSR